MIRRKGVCWSEKPFSKCRNILSVQTAITPGCLHDVVASTFLKKEKKRLKRELIVGKYTKLQYVPNTEAKLYYIRKILTIWKKKNICKKDTKINRSH